MTKGFQSRNTGKSISCSWVKFFPIDIFIEIEFRYHTVRPFKACSSTVFSLSKKLGIPCYCLIPELFHHAKKEPPHPLGSHSVFPLSPSPWPPLVYFLSLWNCFGNIFAPWINQSMAKGVSQSKLMRSTWKLERYGVEHTPSGSGTWHHLKMDSSKWWVAHGITASCFTEPFAHFGLRLK